MVSQQVGRRKKLATHFVGSTVGKTLLVETLNSMSVTPLKGDLAKRRQVLCTGTLCLRNPPLGSILKDAPGKTQKDTGLG